MVYSADRSKAVVPVLVLPFVALWFIPRGDLFYVLTLCYFVLLFFSPFSIAITLPGEARANLSGFRTFVRFVLVWFYWFSLPLGVWKGLRFVIVSLWTFLSPFFHIWRLFYNCLFLISHSLGGPGNLCFLLWYFLDCSLIFGANKECPDQLA